MPLAESSVAGQLVAGVWALAVGGEDLRHRRIPNVLTFGAMLTGSVVWFATGSSLLGAEGRSMLIAAVVAMLLTLPGYLTAKLGAGDVKLLVAIALLGGLPAVLTSFVVGALGAGAVVVAWVILGPHFGLSPLEGRRLPFGTALALGFIVALAGGQTGNLPWH